MNDVDRLIRRGFSRSQAHAIARRPKWAPPPAAFRYNVAIENHQEVLERIVLEGDDLQHVICGVRTYVASKGWVLQRMEVRGSSASTGSITVLVS